MTDRTETLIEARQRRRPRTDRDRARRVRLTERDLWILEAVAKMRFLTTSQLGRLHFEGSRSAANKRLRGLLDRGFLRVWIRDLAQDNVYSLAPQGARFLCEHQKDGKESWASPRGLDGNLEHLLAINDVRITLALGLGAAGGEIAWWRSDWELRSAARAAVIPDALLTIRWDGAEDQVFVLEVDNATRSAKGFLRKILRYHAREFRGQTLYGIRGAVILAVGRDERWLERYRLALAKTRVRTPIWFAALGALTELGVTGEVWRRPEGQEQYSLRTLANLPYGKEDQDAESARHTGA